MEKEEITVNKNKLIVVFWKNRFKEKRAVTPSTPIKLWKPKIVEEKRSIIKLAAKTSQSEKVKEEFKIKIAIRAAR